MACSTGGAHRVAAATTGAESQLPRRRARGSRSRRRSGDACEALGARVLTVALPAAAAGAGGPALGGDGGVEGAVARALERLGAVELLVLDASSLFAARTEARRPARRSYGCLDATWTLTRAVATRAFIGRQASGRMFYVAPARANCGRGSV